jgi:hypothetical protein
MVRRKIISVPSKIDQPLLERTALKTKQWAVLVIAGG